MFRHRRFLSLLMISVMVFTCSSCSSGADGQAAPAGSEPQYVYIETEIPVERIVYVDREVPVEKIVLVDREVPVEKIVYVDRNVPSETTVYVDREVPVVKYETKVVESIYDAIDTSSSVYGSFTLSLDEYRFNAWEVYMGHPRDLLNLFRYEQNMEFDPTEVTMSSSDTSVAVVDDYGNVHGLREGTCKITYQAVNAKGKKVKATYDIYVTTFNDGCDPKTFRSSSGPVDSYARDPNLAANGTWVKENINTILDLISLLQYRHIYYDYMTPITMDYLADGWTWAQDGNATFISGRGVCCDIANAAAFALQNDFEDQGVVYVTGNNGHAFNWFYEDGHYIVCDFTQVIADIRDGYEGYDYIHVYDDIEAMKKDLARRYVNPDETINVFMVSAFGHDHIPAIYIADYCHDSSRINPSMHARIGVEPIVYDNLIMIYENPDLPYIKITEIPYSQIPYDVPVYGHHEGMGADTSGRYKGSAFTGITYEKY